MQRIFDSVAESCELLGCGKTKIYDLIGRGEIRAVKLDRSTKIFHADLLALADRLPNLGGLRSTDHEHRQTNRGAKKNKS